MAAKKPKSTKSASTKKTSKSSSSSWIQNNVTWFKATCFVLVFGLIGVFILVLSNAEANKPEIESGANVAGDWCINDVNGSVAANNSIDTEKCDGSTKQQWQFYSSDGTIRNTALAGTHCLVTKNATMTTGIDVDTPIVIGSCNGWGSVWSRYNGGFQNRNATSNNKNIPAGLCLALPGGSTAAQLRIEACSTTDNQNWTTTLYGAGTAAYYRNPLRDISNFQNGRVDQGVDFGGAGAVYSVGDGVIEGSTTGAAWPSGVFIRYKLTSGPASGYYIYVAEDCSPVVSLRDGTKVTSSTVLCRMYNGSSGIETGWANPPSGGWTAHAYAEYAGRADGLPTNYGVNFGKFLRSFHAPGGDISKSTDNGNVIISGTPLPSDWHRAW